VNTPSIQRLLSASLTITLLCLGGCTTVENRRDLYFPQCVWGPYTKMLHHNFHAPGQPRQKQVPNGNGKDVVKPRG
jgi:hypothetical protein